MAVLNVAIFPSGTQPTSKPTCMIITRQFSIYAGIFGCWKVSNGAWVQRFVLIPWLVTLPKLPFFKAGKHMFECYNHWTFNDFFCPSNICCKLWGLRHNHGQQDSWHHFCAHTLCEIWRYLYAHEGLYFWWVFNIMYNRRLTLVTGSTQLFQICCPCRWLFRRCVAAVNTIEWYHWNVSNVTRGALKRH